MNNSIPLRRFCLLVCTLPAIAHASGRDGGNAGPFATVAESSEFRATARYAEVVELVDRITVASPLVRRVEMGKTGEGRTIPMMIIADPPVATPEEAARQVAENHKLLVLAIGNIHAGEVDGKEALPMVARELTGLLLSAGDLASAAKAADEKGQASLRPLLKDLIVAIAPIYNCDGNERVSKDNRPGQIGPEDGMGRRENAAGLDLNRDFIKLEASETRGLVDFMNRWDPAIFIDTHTTNGCYHRYIITYEGPKAPAGNREVLEFVRDTMFPAIARDAESTYGVPCFVYGDFNREHTRWDSYPAQARYGTTYVGLRNRISILSEGYSYATYKQRVLGTRDFVKSCLEYAAANKERIRQLLADADAATLAAGREPKAGDLVGIRTKVVAPTGKVSAHGFVEAQKEGHVVSTGTPKDYEIELWTHFEPTARVKRPYAYLIPPELTEVVEKLRQHGIDVQQVSDDCDLPVEAYRVEDVERAKEPFQKHETVKLRVSSRSESRRIHKGMILVSTAQRLGSLVVYLLEPECEDGLVTWNYLDGQIGPGSDYPILRVAAPLPH